ncbi:class I tRNA ligase family protein [Actinacidiphila glaucinigra]|uniref:Methionyl-tRNA synthetase n=1 Tax=Actinacidiphila glaucinigra TaxID=235986 RepID=A0A239NMR5_9ACTN|nr:class I tRNA ligase family protein [Actinacidiphila glaucinigra]SNT56191.1 methionyl-tRNA synthetase [Actinacidiphila glaucinigra]
MAAPLIVVTPPPTPNGRLHIGHVAGPYLRADLFVRLARYLGRESVAHLSHIDTYQSYVPRKARQLGRDTREFLVETREGIRSDFAAFGIVHDLVVDNESANYLRFLDSAISTLTQQIEVSEGTSRVCADCNSSLFESNVRGFCPHCLHDAYENVCENCCAPQLYDSMLSASCGTCGARGHVDESDGRTQRLSFDVGDIDEVYRTVARAVGGNRRIKSMFQNLGAHSLGLSYSTDYGVFPKGIPGALNPWVEIYFSHLYGVLTAAGIDTNQTFPALVEALTELPEPPALAYFFGVDNSYYYSFLFPYLSLRLGIPSMLPTSLQASYFLLLNNSKVSSSRNNATWAADLRETGPLPRLRTGLASSCPEYSNRNYDVATELAATVTTTASNQSQAALALQSRLLELTTPSQFSVESILNVFAKGRNYAAHSRSAGNEQEADAMDSMLSELAGHLVLS